MAAGGGLISAGDGSRLCNRGHRQARDDPGVRGPRSTTESSPSTDSAIGICRGCSTVPPQRFRRSGDGARLPSAGNPSCCGRMDSFKKFPAPTVIKSPKPGVPSSWLFLRSQGQRQSAQSASPGGLRKSSRCTKKQRFSDCLPYGVFRGRSPKTVKHPADHWDHSFFRRRDKIPVALQKNGSDCAINPVGGFRPAG